MSRSDPARIVTRVSPTDGDSAPGRVLDRHAGPRTDPSPDDGQNTDGQWTDGQWTDGPATVTPVRPDLRLVPAAVAAWLACLWALAHSQWSSALLGVVTLVVVLVVVAGGGIVASARGRGVRASEIEGPAPRRLPWWWQPGVVRSSPLVLQVVAMALVAASCVLVTTAHVHRVQDSAIALAAARGTSIQIEVVVAGDPVSQAGRFGAQVRARATATSVQDPATGRKLPQRHVVVLRATGAWAPWLSAQAVGTTLVVQGRTSVPDEPGIAANVSLTRATVVRGPPWTDRTVNRLRSGLVSSTGWSPPLQAGLVPSLVVGDTSALDPGLKADFKATGLTHLTAVSGTNLTLLLATLLVVARVVGVRGWWLRILAVAGVGLFVVICRSEPSVVRAAAMGVVGLAALGSTRDRARGVRHLAGAVLVLLWLEPLLAASWGFSLSVVASAGLLWWGGRWTDALSRWLPRWLAEALAVPMAAQVATQPLVTVLQGAVSTTGLLANVLSGPFVGPTTVLGMVAVVTSQCWSTLGRVFGWLAGWMVQPVIMVARLGASLPGGQWRWPTGVAGVILMTATCLVIGLVLERLLASARATIAMAAALVVAMVWQPPPPQWPGSWQLAFCAVGQGDATVVRTVPGHAVLIDVGPEPESGQPSLLRCLASLGVRTVDMVLLTHYHADHVGGLQTVLAQYRVGAVVVNAYAEPAPMVARVRRLAAAAHVPVQVAVRLQQWQLGPARFVMVATGEPPASATDHQSSTGSSTTGASNTSKSMGESPEQNDSSMVIHVDNGLTALVTGDVEPAGQDRIMAAVDHHQLPADVLHASVLKMPHHGSARQSAQFWQATGSSIAVASAGHANSYGHPNRKALQLAEQLSMQVLRTDDDASFALWASDNQVQVRASQVS